MFNIAIESVIEFFGRIKREAPYFLSLFVETSAANSNCGGNLWKLHLPDGDYLKVMAWSEAVTVTRHGPVDSGRHVGGGGRAGRPTKPVEPSGVGEVVHQHHCDD